MKKRSSVPLAIVVTALFVAAPLGYLWNSEKMENQTLTDTNTELSSELDALKTAAQSDGEMLFYDLNGLNVAATSKEIAFNDFFSTDELNARATDCQKTVDPSYYTTLENSFADMTGMQYSFTANEAENEVYTVTVFPNAPAYKDFEAFHSDFEACSAGQTAAARMNEKTLMFTSPCSAAYEETPALTCSDIQKDLVVEFN